jgi:deoxyribose-phosphate aldolase
MDNTKTTNLKPKDLASFIDHTSLKPEIYKAEIIKLCEEALENNFFSVCINPSNISFARDVLKNSKVKICTVVGFPLGASESSTKTFEVGRAISMGAHEIDMVLNIGALKSRRLLACKARN